LPESLSWRYCRLTRSGDFAEYAGATTETKIAITVAAMAVPGRANSANPLELRKLPTNGAAGVNKIPAINAMPASKRTPRASYRKNREVKPTMPAANNGSAATSQTPRLNSLRRKVKNNPATVATQEGTNITKLMPCVSQAMITDSSVHQIHTPAHNPQNPARAAKSRANNTTTEIASDQNAMCVGRASDGEFAGITPTVWRTK